MPSPEDLIKRLQAVLSEVAQLLKEHNENLMALTAAANENTKRMDDIIKAYVKDKQNNAES